MNMTLLSKVMQGEEVDLAYLAGFFDGEGCIHIGKRKSGYYQLRVIVGNSNELVINWLHSAFGGCVCGREPKNGRRYSWTWSLGDRGAEEFLVLILPYLVIKRPEAELALDFMQTKVPQNSGGKIAPQTALQEEQRILMQALKRQ